jgi:hypothetical protein
LFNRRVNNKQPNGSFLNYLRFLNIPDFAMTWISEPIQPVSICRSLDTPHSHVDLGFAFGVELRKSRPKTLLDVSIHQNHVEKSHLPLFSQPPTCGPSDSGLCCAMVVFGSQEGGGEAKEYQG